MISWFRDRIKNSRPWFRYTRGITESIEGHKLGNRSLLITVKFRGEWVSITMPSEDVRKLRDWLNRTYPGTSEVSNVVNIRMAESLPVSGTPRDPETDPQFTG